MSFGDTPEGFDVTGVDTFMRVEFRIMDPDIFVISKSNQAVVSFPIVSNDDTIWTRIDMGQSK